jgi:hypothetical protein
LATALPPTHMRSCGCCQADVARDWRLAGRAPLDGRTLRVRAIGATARARRARTHEGEP